MYSPAAAAALWAHADAVSATAGTLCDIDKAAQCEDIALITYIMITVNHMKQ